MSGRDRQRDQRAVPELQSASAGGGSAAPVLEYSDVANARGGLPGSRGGGSLLGGLLGGGRRGRARAEQRPDGEQRRITASLGMIVFLASWTMMFGSLFFSYGLLRFRALVWPPTSMPGLPVGFGAVNTVALVLSSWALYVALQSTRRGQLRRTAPALFAATALASLFLFLQIVSWVSLWRAGLVPSTGQFASLFYLLTVFHGLHVLIGIAALLVLAIQAARGAYTPERHLPLSAWSYYWHFVGVVWALMYVLVYLV